MATKVCNMFSQLGARGVSVLVASGDYGPGNICESQNGTKQFLPAFPASCPFVTTVGATQYVDPEQAASFSGGGYVLANPPSPFSFPRLEADQLISLQQQKTDSATTSPAQPTKTPPSPLGTQTTAQNSQNTTTAAAVLTPTSPPKA